MAFCRLTNSAKPLNYSGFLWLILVQTARNRHEIPILYHPMEFLDYIYGEPLVGTSSS